MTPMVITYGAPTATAVHPRIHLTQEQERRLLAAGLWPRTSTGVEYVLVDHGLHEGEPTWTDAEIDAAIAAGRAPMS